MNITHASMLDIRSGIIVLQVNCMNKVTRGINKTLSIAYPKLKYRYHKHCLESNPKQLFGTYQEIPITNKLIVVNSFSQFKDGNARLTKEKYTNEEYLIANIKEICAKYPEETVYIPYYIGCGRSGGNWDNLTTQLNDLQNLICIKYA